jgi:hypothetical protein
MIKKFADVFLESVLFSGYQDLSGSAGGAYYGHFPPASVSQ